MSDKRFKQIIRLIAVSGMVLIPVLLLILHYTLAIMFDTGLGLSTEIISAIVLASLSGLGIVAYGSTKSTTIKDKLVEKIDE